MTDNERFQLIDTFHQELNEVRVPHIGCVEMLQKESAHFITYCGAFNDVIKMIGAIIDSYSKDSGIPQEDIFSYLAVALGRKEKKKMTYQNNEQYEKDKQRWLTIFNSSFKFGDELVLDGLDVIELSILLNQSKWNGCQDDNNVNNSILVTIKKYDEIVNPPVVDDTNWEEVIENLKLAFAHCHPLDWQEAKAIKKAIAFIKAHTKKG